MNFCYYGPEDVNTMGIELLLNCWMVNESSKQPKQQ